jgi:hypothetical protein
MIALMAFSIFRRQSFWVAPLHTQVSMDEFYGRDS